MDLVSCLSGSSCGSKSWSLTYRIRHCRRRKPITWGRCWRRLKKWAISIRTTSHRNSYTVGRAVVSLEMFSAAKPNMDDDIGFSNRSGPPSAGDTFTQEQYDEERRKTGP